MNGKRPADPGPARPMKKGKKQVSAEFSDAVTEEILRKQVAEAWSCRTPFSHDIQKRGKTRVLFSFQQKLLPWTWILSFTV